MLNALALWAQWRRFEMRFILESCLCPKCSAITGWICNETHQMLETCESEIKGWRGWWGRGCIIVSTFFPCPSRCNHPRDDFQCLSQSGCCRGGLTDCGRPDPLKYYLSSEQQGKPEHTAPPDPDAGGVTNYLPVMCYAFKSIQWFIFKVFQRAQ